MFDQKLMEHYHNSPYHGRLENPSVIIDATSHSCGDHIIFTLQIVDGHMEEIKYSGEGSVLGMIVASLLCEWVTGRPLSEIEKINVQQVISFMGVELGPTRKRTVQFMVDTLHKGIREYVAS